MTLLSAELLPTKSYPFSVLRYMWQQKGIQEGVVAAGDFAVTQRGAGANMTVDVAAGGCWVQGDDIARQGLYHLVNDATQNSPTFTAAHATLPRLDQVIGRIYDSSVVGVSDTPGIEIVTGTATSGATIDNRTGAAALPNGAIRLADVLVPAAAGSIINAYIRDRRSWARGAYWKNSPTNNYSRAVASWAAIDTTNLQARIECSGAPLELSLACAAWKQTAGNASLGFLVDGTQTGDYTWDNFWTGSASREQTLVTEMTPAAGSHLITAAFKSGDTNTYSIDGSAPTVMIVREMPRQLANNGTA